MMRRLMIYAVVLAAVGGYLAWRTQPPADLVVVLAADGRLQLDQTVLTPTELANALRARMDRAPQPALHVQVDPHAPVTAMIPVMDAVRASGAADVRVATLE